MLYEQRATLCFLVAFSVACAVADARIYPTDVNVRDFGAKGDGVADDTGALQAAADEAAVRAARMRQGVGGRNGLRNSEGHGPMPRLVFPAGVYCVSNPVFFRRDHQVYGLDGATVRAMRDDTDVFVFTGTANHFVTGLTLEGGARQFLVETYNNEAANFTARDCTFRNAKGNAIDSHSWQLPKSAERPNMICIGTYRKDSATGKMVKDDRMASPDRKGFANSTLLTVERCRFEDCQTAVDVSPDGGVMREVTVVSSVTTGCVFRVADNMHAYNLDVTLKRPAGAGRLSFFELGPAHGLMVENSRFRSADGRGIALVRSNVKKGSYISNSLFLRGLDVSCGGCPEGAIVVFPDRKPLEFVSLTDVTDTTGRKVKAIAYADGIASEDFDAFRHFKQFSSDLTYSIVLGRNSANIDETLPPAAARYREPSSLAPPPVVSLKVPRLATGGEILWGHDFGVGIRASADDTTAMKRLFAAAATKPNATVVLPPRRILLAETIPVAGSITVSAAGFAMVETTNDAVTLFQVTDGARVAFTHLLLRGGRHQIAADVAKGATVVVDSCRSYDAASAAFFMRTQGEKNDLRFLLNGGVHYHPLWYDGNARAILSDAWFRSLPPKPISERFHEACAIVNRGSLRFQDVLGVPCVFAGFARSASGSVPKDCRPQDEILPGDYRWIDNHGELHSLFSRFGAEWGGVPLVYDYAGGKVLIEGSYAYFYPRYTAHQPIVTDGTPADLRMYGVVCGFEVLAWYGGLQFLRRKPDGALEPIPNAQTRGNVPCVSLR